MALARTDHKVNVRQKVDTVVERFPALAALRRALRPDHSSTPESLAAHVRSDTPGVLRERLIMAALGDRSARSDLPELTPEIALRTLFFLEHHPSQPIDPWSNRFKREQIPQRLRRIYAPQAESIARGKVKYRQTLDPPATESGGT